MLAVLSDIHGNLEALEAVAADARDRGATGVVCLGDTVGYGPDPVACVEWAARWDVVLMGNFDLATVVGDNPGFAEAAGRSVEWTRRALAEAAGGRLLAFLAARPRAHIDGDVLFVHGSPRSPVNEYLFPEDIYNPAKLAGVGAAFDRSCFCGHTHVPGVFVEAGPGKWEYRAPAEVGGTWRLDERKTIVNVGAVGQPRDEDWRAGYVLLDGPDVTFRRVEYDVDKTVRKIHANPELADFLGDRLREGR